ncbi:nucleoside diphosphate-linked moiety X motif 8 mitochondrial [Biomphalaria pfeifferi]|uniref:Nucleoside diphosphate-linked moiety X motif 8 mitochondrial n=1 Tax=Biomphalaria pfeifferi TaxID=112525 RepID=A0AAD8FEP6_BIOPF|nr:nucleoside diphosphate-linked moiety X motif 8 mitochondrial [Biomphalaria pfeifferi]
MTKLKYNMVFRNNVLLCFLHNYLSRRCQHTTASDQLAYHRLLEDENKKRTQERMNSIHPVRTVKEYALKSGHTNAAVLVPLCTVNNEPSLLLTLRSSKLRKHRGQVSFPGGNVDKTDRDFVHTALRETQEELGLEPSSFDVWGQLNSLPGSDGRKVVYPILAKTGEINVEKLHVNQDEVQEAFSVSLRHLCDPNNCRVTHFRDGPGYTLPVYSGAAHRIWGLTAVIIHQTLSLLAPELYKVKLLARGSSSNGRKTGTQKDWSSGSVLGRRFEMSSMLSAN